MDGISHAQTYVDQLLESNSDSDDAYISDSFSEVTENEKEEENPTQNASFQPDAPFSLEKYNSFHSKSKKRKYISNFSLKKIKITNDNYLIPSFEFDPLFDDSVTKYKRFSQKEIPYYHRDVSKRIVGIKNNQLSELLLTQDQKTFNDYDDQQYINKKRYFNYKGKILINNTNKPTSQHNEKNQELFTEIKANETNDAAWVKYVIHNFSQKYKIKEIFDKIRTINFTKENLLLRVVELQVLFDFDNLKDFSYEKALRNLHKFPNVHQLNIFIFHFINLVQKTKDKSFISKSFDCLFERILALDNEVFSTVVILFVKQNIAQNIPLSFALLSALVEKGILALKKIDYKESDFENYFNSDYKKVYRDDENSGFLNYLLCSRSNTKKPAKNQVQYKEIKKYIKVLDSKGLSMLMKSMLEILIDRSKKINYDIHTAKYQVTFDDKIFETFMQLLYYMRQANEIETLASTYQLDLVMMNSKYSEKEKFEVHSKAIFKNESSQNNVVLYCRLLEWAMYYKRYELWNKIMKLLEMKFSLSSQYANLIAKEKLTFVIVDAINNKKENLYETISKINVNTSYGDDSIELIAAIEDIINEEKSEANQRYDIQKILSKIKNKDDFILNLSNLYDWIYITSGDFERYKRKIMALNQAVNYVSIYVDEISKDIITNIRIRLVKAYSKYNFDIDMCKAFKSFSVEEISCFIQENEAKFHDENSFKKFVKRSFFNAQANIFSLSTESFEESIELMKELLKKNTSVPIK